MYQIDVIDGVTFRTFESENDLATFTAEWERKHAPATTSRRSAAVGKAPSASASASFLDRAPTLKRAKSDLPSRSLAAIPPPPPLTLCKKSEPEQNIINPVKPPAATITSAFYSEKLDEFLSNTKRELEQGNMCNLEHFGSPPEDSPIYSAGVLKIAEKRTPLADRPPLAARGQQPASAPPQPAVCSNAATGAAPVAGMKRPRERWPAAAAAVEPVLDRSAKQTKLAKKVKSAPLPPLAAADGDETNIAAENFYTVAELENRFNDLMQETAENNKRLRKVYVVSFLMDESYARYALEDVVKEPERVEDELPSPPKSASPRKEAEAAASPAEAPSPQVKGKRRSNHVDVATIISRHSKRDIRLPKRFHQSGIIVGNQWVVPGMETSDKKGRRRLIEEQRRLQATHTSHVDAPSKGVLQRIEGFDNINTIAGTEFKRKKKEMVVTQKKPEHTVVTTSNASMQLHQQRMEMLTQKAQKASVSNIVEHRKNMSRVFHTMPKPTANGTVLVPRVPNASGKQTEVKASSVDKTQKLSMLKELYRLLYYENKPQRRRFFQERRQKPRVIKKKVVDEGIRVIKRLQNQDKQLSYVRNCMWLWNKKLTQCLRALQKGIVHWLLESCVHCLFARRRFCRQGTGEPSRGRCVDCVPKELYVPSLNFHRQKARGAAERT